MIVIGRRGGERLRHVDDIEVSRAGCFTRASPRHALAAGIKLQEKTVHAVTGKLVARPVEILRGGLRAAKCDIADERGIDTGEETIILRATQPGIEQHVDRIPPQPHRIALRHMARIETRSRQRRFKRPCVHHAAFP